MSGKMLLSGGFKRVINGNEARPVEVEKNGKQAGPARPNRSNSESSVGDSRRNRDDATEERHVSKKKKENIREEESPARGNNHGAAGVAGEIEMDISKSATKKSRKSDYGNEVSKPAIITNKTFKEQHVVFIGQLGYNISASEIEYHFEKQGELAKPLSVRLLTNPRDGSSRGMAFATLGSLDDTLKVLALHNTLIGGRRVVIERSVTGRSTKKNDNENDEPENTPVGVKSKRDRLTTKLKKRHIDDHKKYVEFIIHRALQSRRNLAGGTLTNTIQDDAPMDEASSRQIGGRLFSRGDIDDKLMEYFLTVPKGVGEQALSEFLVHLRHDADNGRRIRNKRSLLMSIIKRLHTDTDTVQNHPLSHKQQRSLERAQARKLATPLPSPETRSLFLEHLDPKRKALRTSANLHKKTADY